MRRDESELDSTHVPTPEQSKWATREQSGLKGTTHPSEDPNGAERYAQHPEQRHFTPKLGFIPEVEETLVRDIDLVPGNTGDLLDLLGTCILVKRRHGET